MVKDSTSARASVKRVNAPSSPSRVGGRLRADARDGLQQLGVGGPSAGLAGWQQRRRGAVDLVNRAGESLELTHQRAHDVSARGRRLATVVRLLTRANEAERLLELARVQRRMAGNSWSYFWLCQSYLRLGRPQDAERVVPRVLEPRKTAAAAHASYLEGEIAVRPDRWQPATAAERYRSALELAAGCGMRPLLAHCHLGLGKLYGRTGKREQAQEHLATATTMYREMDMQFWREKAEGELRGS